MKRGEGRGSSTWDREGRRRQRGSQEHLALVHRLRAPWQLLLVPEHSVQQMDARPQSQGLPAACKRCTRTSLLPSAAAAASTGIVMANLASHSGRLVMSRTSSSAALPEMEGSRIRYAARQAQALRTAGACALGCWVPTAKANLHLLSSTDERDPMGHTTSVAAKACAPTPRSPPPERRGQERSTLQQHLHLLFEPLAQVAAFLAVDDQLPGRGAGAAAAVAAVAGDHRVRRCKGRQRAATAAAACSR